MTHGKKKFPKNSRSIYSVTLSIFLYMLSGVAFAEIPYIPFGPKGLLFSCHQEQTRSECRGTLLDADGTEVRFRRAKDSIKIRMRKAAQRRKRAKIRGDRKALLRAIADASTLRQVRNGMHGWAKKFSLLDMA